MVALAPNTSETSTWDVLDGFPKLHSRAREAITARCTEVPHSKSFGRVEIWLTIYESCDGLESFTRDPIGFDAKSELLYEFVAAGTLNGLDPSGKVAISCTCNCNGGRSIGQHLEDRVVDCPGLASKCCSDACNTPFYNGSCHFSGTWKQVMSQEDDTKIAEEVIDAASDVICSVSLVCDVITFPIPGDGATCAGGTIVLCGLIKNCIKSPKKPGKCEFLLAWCLWGNNRPKGDRGKGWKRNAPCFDCYTDCKKHKGIWSFGKCPLGHFGSRWRGDDDSVWPIEGEY